MVMVREIQFGVCLEDGAHIEVPRLARHTSQHGQFLQREGWLSSILNLALLQPVHIDMNAICDN